MAAGCRQGGQGASATAELAHRRVACRPNCQRRPTQRLARPISKRPLRATGRAAPSFAQRRRSAPWRWMKALLHWPIGAMPGRRVGIEASMRARWTESSAPTPRAARLHTVVSRRMRVRAAAAAEVAPLAAEPVAAWCTRVSAETRLAALPGAYAVARPLWEAVVVVEPAPLSLACGATNPDCMALWAAALPLRLRFCWLGARRWTAHRITLQVGSAAVRYESATEMFDHAASALPASCCAPARFAGMLGEASWEVERGCPEVLRWGRKATRRAARAPHPARATAQGRPRPALRAGSRSCRARMTACTQYKHRILLVAPRAPSPA